MSSSLQLNAFLMKSFQENGEMTNKVILDFAAFIRDMDPTLIEPFLFSLGRVSFDPFVLIRTSFLAREDVSASFRDKFYEILASYGYRKQDELLEVLYTTFAKGEKRTLDFWKKTPWFQNISYDENSQKLSISMDDEIFSFWSSWLAYHNDIDYILQKGKEENRVYQAISVNGYNPDSFDTLRDQCHFAAFHFAKLHPGSSLVTAVCPHGFQNQYWLHSYNILEDGKTVVDLANYCVINLEDYERLMKPNVLANNKGCNVEQILDELASKNGRLLMGIPSLDIAFYEYDKTPVLERTLKF